MDLVAGPLDWGVRLSDPPLGVNDLPAGGSLQEVDAQFIATLQERSRQAPWRAYQDVVPDWFRLYLMAEPELEEIRTYAPLRIPSLLQTGEYARRIISQDLPRATGRELERRVELRLCRQDILDRPDGPKVWVLLHQNALGQDAGSPPVLRAQIRHLIRLADQSNITLQVVPPPAANLALADGPLTIMRFPESGINDMVYLEQRAHALYVHRQRDISYFSKMFMALAINALPPKESIRLLRSLL